MTYVVSDGKHVIADRMISADFGGNLNGRSKPGEDNQFVFSSTAKDVVLYFNDANKLVAVKGGTYQGENIRLIALAGSTRNLPDLLGALTQGVDFHDYLKVEANVQPVEERRIFCGDATIMITLESGETIKFSPNGSSIRHYRSAKFVHMGSGADIVDPIRDMLTFPEGKNTRLTALEAFVVASSHCDSVSREFNYYDIEKNKFYYDQRLSDRQTKEILARIHRRLNFETIRKEQPYQNK